MNYTIAIIIVTCFTLFFLTGCASVVYSTKNLPKNYMELAKSNEVYIEFDPIQTDIGKMYAEELKSKPKASGAMLITDGSFALLHRIALVRMAKHTIELQTYIYENDIASRILMYEMKLAADRGVKVRILVDDNGLDSDNSDIMLLDYHENIDVKVFNPFKYRSKALKYPQFALDISRLNHRMHNKLFNVDNIAAIIGGRNIAANYFDSNMHMNFTDTDVLFVGLVAKQAVESFNEYWKFHRSIPVSAFPDRKNNGLDEYTNLLALIAKDNSSEGALYSKVVQAFIDEYNKKVFPIYWGYGNVIADSPFKVEKNSEKNKIKNALDYLTLVTRDSINISAAYFVPGKYGTEDLIDIHKNGVKIRILTNSLSSTDASVVYSAWEKYRDKLLKNGIEIYEFKRIGIAKNIRKKTKSNSSLHSKTIVFDDRISWIGSFNLDARSAEINTEVVVAFESVEFAKILNKNMLDDMSLKYSYKLELVDGNTTWIGIVDEQIQRFYVSPGTSFFERFIKTLAKILPETQI